MKLHTDLSADVWKGEALASYPPLEGTSEPPMRHGTTQRRRIAIPCNPGRTRTAVVDPGPAKQLGRTGGGSWLWQLLAVAACGDRAAV